MSSIIEICYNGVWKRVCEPLSDVSANMLCKQLGFYGISGKFDQAFMLRKELFN